MTKIPVGSVNYGDLARLKPISKAWGFDRGVPIDRVYIERFLTRHSDDVFGRILEVKDSHYGTTLGKAGSKVDVLDIDDSNKKATIIADLQDGRGIADDTYDCIILTQVLQLVYDLRAAVDTLHRILKPGGVLLLTVAGISRAGPGDGPWYWSFHEPSVRRLLGEYFDSSRLLVGSHGNLCEAIAFLQGLAHDELPEEVRDVEDKQYPIVITARAVKAAAST